MEDLLSLEINLSGTMNIYSAKFFEMSRVSLFAISIFLFPNLLYAIGLGELKVLSSLGEEFVAEVELMGVDSDDPAIRDYNVSIEPVPDSLPGIKEYVKKMFVSVNLEDGNPKLFISHPHRFNELFIEFSISIFTAEINILRSYTAIIDIPDSMVARSTVQSAVVQQPVQEALSEDAVEIVDFMPDQSQSLWQGSSGSRVVHPGETLYTIAQEIQRQYGGNINQIMDAIFADNPRAFINNNRDLILAGAPLDIKTNPENQQVAFEPIAEQFDEYGPVQEGDTLFQIAKRYRHQYDLSIPNLAGQIFELNRQAFIRDDINLLRQDVMLKLPASDSSATSVKLDERGTEIIAANEVTEDGQYLEILTLADSNTDNLYGSNITAQDQQEQLLRDTLIDMEEVIRLNSELKNSIEIGTEQINNLQQNLDASNAEIEELKAQIDEIKNQYNGSSNTQVQTHTISGKDTSEEVIQTTTGKLIANFREVPWTALIIIIIVSVSIVLLIMLLYKLYANNRNERLSEEAEFVELMLDNELKVRIKQKLEKDYEYDR